MSFDRPLSFLIAFVFASCATGPQTAVVPATVEGYKKALEDRLGSFWYREAEIHGDQLSVGTVKTTCELPAAGGRIRNLKILSNTGNVTNEMIVRNAMSRSRVPPIPPAILEHERKDFLMLDETFTVFPSDSKPAPSPKMSKER